MEASAIPSSEFFRLVTFTQQSLFFYVSILLTKKGTGGGRSLKYTRRAILFYGISRRGGSVMARVICRVEKSQSRRVIRDGHGGSLFIEGPVVADQEFIVRDGMTGNIL